MRLEHTAGVAVEFVFNNRDVDVHCVTWLENSLSRYAMANDMIQRRADRFGKSAVIKRRRYRILRFGDELVANCIQFARAYTRLDVAANHIQDVGRQAPGNTHLGLLFRCFYGDVHEVGGTVLLLDC